MVIMMVLPHRAVVKINELRYLNPFEQCLARGNQCCVLAITVAAAFVK